MPRKDLNTKEWKALRLVVLARDQHTCYVCRGEADQVDHIIAKVQGGDNSLGNLAAICRQCNSRKGSTVDRPRRHTTSRTSVRFSDDGTPTRSSARLSLPETKSPEGNPFQ